mgnify:CR=1 FL=1
MRVLMKVLDGSSCHLYIYALAELARSLSRLRKQVLPFSLSLRPYLTEEML